MDRRTFLMTAAGGAVAALEGSFPRLAAASSKPWFDGTYSELPTIEQQTEGLSEEAVAAQQKPRVASGLPITGLPTEIGPHDEQIAELVKKSGAVGVAYAIAVNRKLKVARGVGYLSSHERLPATPTAPGYLGSITKPLCAMTALTLVREGKLQLDQKVMEVSPMSPLLKPGEKRQPEIDQVIVRMLMNHTSGLFNAVEVLFDREYYRHLAAQGKLQLVHGDISQYDLVRRGMATPFVSKPGTEFHYSGEGLQVLGRIVEKLTGQRLDFAMSARALQPLGIQHLASLGYLAPDVFAQIAAGRASKTNTFIPSPFNEAKKVCVSWASRPTEDLYGQQWGQADACGASMLSAVNLLRFVTFCPRLLGKELSLEAFTPPKTPPYSNGLGWGVGVDKNGHHQWGHTGAIMGCRSIGESLSENVQYAVLMAGDRDADFDKIGAAVREYGKSLRKADVDIGDWQAYGFPADKPSTPRADS